MPQATLFDTLMLNNTFSKPTIWHMLLAGISGRAAIAIYSEGIKKFEWLDWGNWRPNSRPCCPKFLLFGNCSLIQFSKRDFRKLVERYHTVKCQLNLKLYLFIYLFFVNNRFGSAITPDSYMRKSNKSHIKSAFEENQKQHGENNCSFFLSFMWILPFTYVKKIINIYIILCIDRAMLVDRIINYFIKFRFNFIFYKWQYEKH